MNIQTDEYNFINKKSAGSEYFYKCKNKGKMDIEFYRSFIKKFKSEYGSINVPNYYKHTNVLVQGNPNLGRFIEFTLDEKCSVFYLEDAATLSPYWKDKFSRLQKVDEKWYYECK